MTEQVKMQFPADTEYIGAIRLAVSGVAGALDYNIDEIEDIKSCVAEACLLLLCGQECDALKINLEVGKDLKFKVSAKEAKPMNNADCADFSEEISRLMIEALSENAYFEEENGILNAISFEKSREIQ